MTDEQGKPVTTYKLWVVGEFYLENEKPAYYKRRIVRARTPKEAVYKYKQVDASLDISLSCLGEKDNESDYSLNIENDEDFLVALGGIVSMSALLKNVAQAMIDEKYPEPIEDEDSESDGKEKEKEDKERKKREKEKEKEKKKAKKLEEADKNI